MAKVIVRILSGGFVVHPTSEMFATFTGWLQRMYRFEYSKVPVRNGRVVTYVGKNQLKEKWCIEDKKSNTYRINNSFLEEFKRHFSMYDIKYIVEPFIMGDKVEIEMQDWYKPKDDQPNWIKFLSQTRGPHLSLPATMGGGKTVTFIATAAKIGRRTAVVIPPFLSDRWLLEIGKFTKLTDKEYCYISGGNMLKSYMATLDAGKNPFKIVLFSINTLRNYIRDYSEFPEGWLYSPEEFFAKANFGLKGVDEAHKELHFHYISTLFFNTNKFINLSGTLGKEDAFLHDMSNRLFPQDGRCPVPDADARTVCSIYKMYYSDWIPKHRSAKGYSHVLYENSIRYHPAIKLTYFKYLAKIVYAEFQAIRKPKDKCLVFMSTIKLADEFTEYLRKDRDVAKHFLESRIGRLAAGEPDDKTLDLDIIVTTLGRGSTGLDIPGILTVFNTIPINDQYLQRQTLGRGRERDDVECRYVRLYSPSVQKHVDYHVKSLHVLNDLASKVEFHELPGSIGKPLPWEMEAAKRMEDAERKARNKNKTIGLKKRKPGRPKKH